MKLRRQQQIERELNGYRAWIDKAGKAWGAAGGGGKAWGAAGGVCGGVCTAGRLLPSRSREQRDTPDTSFAFGVPCWSPFLPLTSNSPCSSAQAWRRV